MRDLQQGIASGRFSINDPLMAFVAVGGTVMAAITAQLELAPKDSPVRTMVQQLGLSKKEADEVANRPLPEVEVESRLI